MKISLNLPDGLILSEVYNIDTKNVDSQNGNHIASGFEMEGYFGGILTSSMYKDASAIKTIKFSLQYDDSVNQVFERNIELFRPDIKISNNISTINIKTRKDNKLVSSEHIGILNHGKGTAIIKVNILNESEIKEGYPEGFEEFRNSFLKDLDDIFVEMKIKFSHYADLLDEVRIIARDPLPSDDKEVKRVKHTVEELEEAFNNNEEFLAEFLHSTAKAYLKNMSIMTDVDAFIAFMRSIGKNKIILFDAMKVLKISTTAQKLIAELVISDLAQNKYPVIKLPEISIIADRECSVPIYQILDPSRSN
ncbi:hypothetical protein QVH35_00835 [Candidatus Nitrosotenuis chungbukensis]|nr:hypothetical protein [Candidatus Nitrosotenuis chungbukensis]WKT58109.1 hypothetical protein QVH35_00835 [Candidatus Nitrosotenuis chungbukensis]